MYHGLNKDNAVCRIMIPEQFVDEISLGCLCNHNKDIALNNFDSLTETQGHYLNQKTE